ncbi:TetR/AcrR family transcriptional regulator [Amycolatopsis sp. NBC_01488]|uniref:TetR/AcrR family transcriptional regulator n=1 Tax=Amycolatopsis sp. NBC_01488 TaxID=2903563 RepID=UPI002E2ACB34|nr:helix-turn-helix domain-containing protein [Amycolatopsis sp. NBC_01488]
MSRWEPNARERLVRVAVESFFERGYDDVTVAEITERAGLTKRTFFRHFADKREVLFAGQDILSRIFTEAIAAAPPSATPIEAVAAALAATEAAFDADRRASARKIQQVVAGHADLHERELLKRAKLRSAMADALRTRGVPDPTANLAAEIGGMAFTTAFARWVAPANEQGFGELAREALSELVEAAAALG